MTQYFACKRLVPKSLSPEALNLITTKALAPLYGKKGGAPTFGQKELNEGKLQTTKITPQDSRFKVNTHQIGIVKNYDLSRRGQEQASNWMDPRFGSYHRSRKRIARIYQEENQHVQDTPKLEQGERWKIQMTRNGDHRSDLNGWTRNLEGPTNDMMGSLDMWGYNLEEAATWCRNMGWGIDIIYPNDRWFKVKEYADNFKYKGPHHEEEDEQIF